MRKCSRRDERSALFVGRYRRFRKWRTISYGLGGQHTKWIMSLSAIFEMAGRSAINLYMQVGGSSAIFEIVYGGTNKDERWNFAIFDTYGKLPLSKFNSIPT